MFIFSICKNLKYLFIFINLKNNAHDFLQTKWKLNYDSWRVKYYMLLVIFWPWKLEKNKSKASSILYARADIVVLSLFKNYIKIINKLITYLKVGKIKFCQLVINYLGKTCLLLILWHHDISQFVLLV
jgi:hypothetical protein